MDDKDKRFQDGVAEETASRGAALLDEELPGFKINYNGSDESSEDDFAAREGDGGGNGVETAADVAEAVPMGDRPVENGSVTRGEGENKPVMLENESLGGLNEMALKTAPGGLKTDSEGAEEQFAGNVSKAVGGSAGDGAGVGSGKQGITEAEARAMLIEDNARAKEDLKKANAKGRKTLVVVIILAVVLIIAGIAVSVILGGRDKDGNNDKQEENGENAVVEKPEGADESEAQLVELSLDDEVVQRVYEPFAVINDSYWSPFYFDEIGDGYDLSEEDIQQRRRQGRLSIAYLNTPKEACKATIENGGLIDRYGDFIVTNWTAEQRGEVEQCVSGEKVRQNFKNIFGYDIELRGFDDYRNKNGATNVDGVFTWSYSPSYDEFYYGLGGAGTPTMYKRRLVGAEKEADAVYLYEQALEYYFPSWAFPDDDNAEFSVSDLTKEGSESNSLKITDTKANVEKILGGDELFNRVERLGDLGMFKWTFRKNAEGNYVFEGLEKVN